PSRCARRSGTPRSITPPYSRSRERHQQRTKCSSVQITLGERAWFVATDARNGLVGWSRPVRSAGAGRWTPLFGALKRPERTLLLVGLPGRGRGSGSRNRRFGRLGPAGLTVHSFQRDPHGAIRTQDDGRLGSDRLVWSQLHVELLQHHGD